MTLGHVCETLERSAQVSDFHIMFLNVVVVSYRMKERADVIVTLTNFVVRLISEAAVLHNIFVLQVHSGNRQVDGEV